MRWGRVDDRDRCRLVVYRVPVSARDHQLGTGGRARRNGFRDMQELMLGRSVDVSDETIRAWCDRFGQQYANELRRRGRRPGEKWHLDEVFVQINGAQRYLWRAVDQPGTVLDVLVGSGRNAVAAKKFFRRWLKGLR